MFGLYLYIEGTLDKTCKSEMDGYCMGIKNDFRSMGLSHLHSEILGPSIPEHRIKTEIKSHSEKGLFDTLFGMQDLWCTQRVGFWFSCGVDAITIGIKTGY